MLAMIVAEVITCSCGCEASTALLGNHLQFWVRAAVLPCSGTSRQMRAPSPAQNPPAQVNMWR